MKTESKSTKTTAAASSESKSSKSAQLKTLFLGDTLAKCRTVQFILRMLAILQFSLYLIPFHSYHAMLYANFFKITLVNFVGFLAYTHGKPTFTADYARQLAQDRTSHAIFYCCIMWFAPCDFLAMLPILISETLFVAMTLTSIFTILESSFLTLFATHVEPVIAQSMGQHASQWNSMNASGKWSLLMKQVPVISALLTVLMGVKLAVMLVFPARNVILTVVYWQHLKIVYLISADIRGAFDAYDVLFASLLSHKYCPTLLARAYAMVKKGLAYMAQPPTAGGNAAAARPSCVIM